MPVVFVVGAAAPSSYISVPLIQQTVSATLDFSTSVYLMEFKLNGSLVSGIMDTGSDLTWTNNSQLVDSATSFPCYNATTTKGKGRRSNCDLVVDSDVNSCTKEDANKEYYLCGGDCIFNISYADGSVARGVMANGTLILGGGENTPRPIFLGSAVNLGCKPSARVNDRRCGSYSAGGTVGLGPGKLSLVQQLDLHGFSYLLAGGEKDKSSKIVFYLYPEPLPPVPGQADCWESTPLVDIQGAGHFPRYYYVKLTGISMGGQELLDIPKTAFSMDTNSGDRGMIIHSGSTYTKLPKEVFGKVSEAVAHQMNMNRKPNPANTGMTCFEGAKLPNSMPNMELRFAGEAKMILPVANYMAVDGKYGESCLAMKEAHDNSVDTFILGNFQQKNIEMFFDIRGKKLSFKSSKCSGDMHAAV